MKHYDAIRTNHAQQDRERLARSKQESLLALLIFDEAYGGTVAKLVSPQLFDGDYADTARGVCEYWKNYAKPPKHQVDELFADIFTERTGRDITYGNLFSALFEMHARGINAQFCLDNINEFIEYQRLKRLIVDSAEKARSQGERSLPEINKLFDEHRKLRMTHSASSNLMAPSDLSAIFAEEAYTSEFSTGVKALDDLHVRPQRGTTLVAVGGTKAGKSHYLLACASFNAYLRKRVLYVTYEMDGAEVWRRLWQSWLGGARNHEVEYFIYAFEGEDEQLAIVREELKPSFVIRSDFDWDDAGPATSSLAKTVGALQKDSNGLTYWWVDRLNNNLRVLKLPK